MSKSEFKRVSITTGIKTQAGLELFKKMNEQHGSNVWGPVLKGILAIELEMGRDRILDEMIDHAIENDLYEKTKDALPKKELS